MGLYKTVYKKRTNKYLITFRGISLQEGKNTKQLRENQYKKYNVKILV